MVISAIVLRFGTAVDVEVPEAVHRAVDDTFARLQEAGASSVRTS
jgi:hypothetical protein